MGLTATNGSKNFNKMSIFIPPCLSLLSFSAKNPWVSTLVLSLHGSQVTPDEAEEATIKIN
jgi:hypothetical protein